MQAHVFRACICIIHIFIYCENKIPKEFFYRLSSKGNFDMYEVNLERAMNYWMDLLDDYTNIAKIPNDFFIKIVLMK